MFLVGESCHRLLKPSCPDRSLRNFGGHKRVDLVAVSPNFWFENTQRGGCREGQAIAIFVDIQQER